MDGFAIGVLSILAIIFEVSEFEEAKMQIEELALSRDVGQRQGRTTSFDQLPFLLFRPCRAHGPLLLHEHSGKLLVISIVIINFHAQT